MTKVMTNASTIHNASFKAILPENIDWKPFAALPAPVRLAMIIGHPSKPEPFMIRVRVPDGVILMPHRHPEDRIYTVISGVSTSALVSNSTPTNLRRIHREV